MHTATRLFCILHSLLVLVFCRFFSFVFQSFFNMFYFFSFKSVLFCIALACVSLIFWAVQRDHITPRFVVCPHFFVSFKSGLGSFIFITPILSLPFAFSFLFCFVCTPFLICPYVSSFYFISFACPRTSTNRSP